MSDFAASLYPAPPFYAGQANYAGANPPNTVVIDGRTYGISLENYVNTALPAFRQGIVTSGEPSDQLFNPDGGWWRYRFDWQYGAGQKLLDLGEDRLGAQFRTSTNINIWDENQLSIGPKVEEIYDAEGNNTAAVTVYTFDDTLYICTGKTLLYGSDYTFTTLCSFGTDSVSALTFDGNYIWAISPTTLYRVTASTGVVTTTSITATNQFDSIAYVGNHLLVGDGPLLREILSAGSSSSTIYTFYDTSFKWTTIIAAGSAVYVGGYGGSTSKLFSMTNITSGALAVGNEATTFPANERLFGGFGYGSIVVLQTSHGVRIGSVGANTITYGPLLPSENPVFACAAEGSYIWYGATRDDQKPEIVRANLETFTDTLKPAYASEVLLDNTAGKSIPSIVRYAEPSTFAAAPGEYQRYEQSYTVFSTLEGKVYRVGGNYQTTGSLSTGEIFFGTAEMKSLGQIEVGFEPLEANQSVTMQAFDVDSGQQLASVIGKSEGQTSLSLPATGYLFQKIEIVLTLTGDGTSSPIVRQWKANAFPVAPPVQRWRVPVMLYNTVIYGDGQGQHLLLQPWEELEHIRSLWANRTIFIYREGIHQHRVRMDTFTVQPTRWDEDGDWLEAIVFVEMLSV